MGKNLHSLFDEIIEDINDKFIKNINNAVVAASDSTRLDKGRLVGNWDVVFNYGEVRDFDPIEIGRRKTALRRDVNASRSIDRSSQDANRFDIMTNNKVSIVNATEYALYWDPVDGMTRRAEEQLIL